MRIWKNSIVLALAMWLLAAGAALFLGWSFNNAYYSMLGDTQRQIVKFLSVSSLSYGENIVPYTTRVFQAFLVTQVVASGLCILFSFIPAGTSPRKRFIILLAGVSLPILFYLVAGVSRSLSENGIISVVDMQGLPSAELQVGESFIISGYKFSKLSSGIAVENLLDSRSVFSIFIDSAESVWVNHLALALLTAALFATVIARTIQQFLRRDSGPPVSD